MIPGFASKFANWPENLPREDLVRLLRGYANVARKVEQTIAASFPDEFPLGDGDIVPVDERVVIDHDAVAMAEKAVAELDRLRENKLKLAAAYHSVTIECNRLRAVLQSIGDHACARYFVDNCVVEFPNDNYAWCGPCVARKALGPQT